MCVAFRLTLTLSKGFRLRRPPSDSLPWSCRESCSSKHGSFGGVESGVEQRRPGGRDDNRHHVALPDSYTSIVIVIVVVIATIAITIYCTTTVILLFPQS